MSLRLLSTFSDAASGYAVKVYRDSEWTEYRYVSTLNGKRFSSLCDGFADERDDAEASAKATLRMLVERAA